MNPSASQLRFGVGALVIIVIGVLLYLGTISTEAGLAIIVAVASGLGLYERRARNGGG